jgi:hypothetical protein
MFRLLSPQNADPAKDSTQARSPNLDHSRIRLIFIVY